MKLSRLLQICLVLAGSGIYSVLPVWAKTDPTRPQDLKPAQLQTLGIELEPDEPTYTLQYVLYSTERRYAVINGKRVREGERVDDARVLLIRPGEVRIQVPGEVRELRLGFHDIKKVRERSSR